HRNDPPRIVRVDPVISLRQRESMRWADAEYTPVEIETDRPPPDTDRPARDQVTGCVDLDVARVPDRQDGDYPAPRQGPQLDRLVRADGQHPAVAADRCGPVSDGPGRYTGKAPILERRIDSIRGERVIERNDDAPVAAEYWPGRGSQTQPKP